jgi:AcrR family transcriptional regulator
MRLIEAAETLFIRKGFDDTSVDEISEAAGYSRGAFYSNFKDKDQVFLAVIDRRRPSVPRALDEILQQLSEPASRAAAVRDWYSNQWRLADFMALQMDFSRRASKDRFVRKRLIEVRQQEIEKLTTAVVRYFAAAELLPPERPELVGLVLLAVARGLASLALDHEPEREQIYTEAAALVFDRMTAPQISHLGELQC